MTRSKLTPTGLAAEMNNTRNAHKAALARKIAERREELGITQDDVADLGGPSTETVRQWELGKIPNKPRPKTLEQLDYALSWATGSARTLLLRGDEPVPANESTDIAARRTTNTRRVLVEQEQIRQLVQLSTTLLTAFREKEAMGIEIRPKTADAVRSLHLLAAEMAVEALNQ